MKNLLLSVFTWWQGSTIGTRVHTARNGERVGSDEFGNVYYRTRGGKIDPGLGFERRWVIYASEAEASKIPPGWHGWMHHRTDVAPTDETYKAWPWEAPHEENLTGTPRAYHPSGSILGSAQRAPASADYNAWQPE
jgi:NADH:ubiquinone oxidoreductase subunit